MVSKSQKKLIKSLYQKKYRKQHGLFVAEGQKVIRELLNANIKLHTLFTITPSEFNMSKSQMFEVTETELKSISFLTTSQVALAIFYIPINKEPNYDGLTIALDDVRDPGNLGTIIRLCDWFGITQLICSLNTVDCYNPKVVQATMGSITRVAISYTNMQEYLKLCPKEIPIYGTYMHGKIIYSEKLADIGVIVMGNEANGISKDIENLITDKITIPQFGKSQDTESLNVATATAIVLNEFCRDKIIEK